MTPRARDLWCSALPPLPYRGTFGDERPSELARLPLPPGPMPGRQGLRPLKAWRYVGVFGPELMLCTASVRIGPARQAFWAVWDRRARTLYQRTVLGRGRVRLERGRIRVLEHDVQIDLKLDEVPGIESICPSGESYGWTCKQGGIRASGTVALGGVPRPVEALGVVDDTAAYYERHTHWRWCAGVGTTGGGAAVAWNLVSGVNDPPRLSERTVWIDGDPYEVGRCQFAGDLSRIQFPDNLDAARGLRFHAEAVRERRENRLLVRSDYRQPFGSFSGELPGGTSLREGFGVMEDHDVRW